MFVTAVYCSFNSSITRIQNDIQLVNHYSTSRTAHLHRYAGGVQRPQKPNTLHKISTKIRFRHKMSNTKKKKNARFLQKFCATKKLFEK